MDLTRLLPRTPLRRDCVLAVLTALFSVALLWLSELDGGPGAAATALMAAQALALCLRRVSPVSGLLLMLAAQVGLSAASADGIGLRGPALTIAIYTCGTLFTARRALALAGLTALVEIAAYAAFVTPLRAPVLEAAQLAGHLALAVLLYAGAAVVGQNVAMRRRYAEAVEQRVAADAEAHRARTQAALSAERGRMARELHDVAAHHLTSLIVQATLVERMLDRDVEAARRAVVTVREEGRNTLHQLRLIVGALRADGDTDPHLPDGSGLASIDRLVADGAASLTVSGTPAAPSPAVDLTLYRVAQEALANARQHAPGAPVAITIAYRTEEIAMEIRNGRAASGAPAMDRRHPGFGLVGMRERATLIGATLTAGPVPDGGWLIRLTVPRAAATKEPM